jgi:hypothetical protein
VGRNNWELEKYIEGVTGKYVLILNILVDCIVRLRWYVQFCPSEEH